MLSTFGGGSVRGFNGGGGGSAFEFDFTFEGNNSFSSAGDLRVPPTKSELLSIYDTTANPWLNNTSIYDVTNGYQDYTIQQDATYEITAKGAPSYAEGGNFSNAIAGRGAVMRAQFILSAGTTLRMIVGQRGEPITASPQFHTSGGSGGTAVFIVSNSTYYPLIVAGGAGGVGINNAATKGYDAVTSMFGGRSINRGTGTNNQGTVDGYDGGTNGQGGESYDSQSGLQGGGGGAGFRGNGTDHSSAGIAGGQRLMDDGYGGSGSSSYHGGFGGFGGGGATLNYLNQNGYSGGGGGYSGGAGGEYEESQSYTDRAGVGVAHLLGRV